MYDTLIVKEIVRLSQDEGLHDLEIATKLGCSRATIARYKKKYNLPKVNLNNRKDKTYFCSRCGKEVIIRRFEKRRLYCNECQDKIR